MGRGRPTARGPEPLCEGGTTSSVVARRPVRRDGRHRVEEAVMSGRSRIIAALVAGAVSFPLSAAASGSAAPSAFPSDRGGTGSATVPELDWGSCGDDFGGSDGPPGTTFSCAWATVPLDYDQPRGAEHQVALKRLEAGQPGKRIGTLFINPGGP